MKITYLLHNHGIAGRTPPGWQFACVTPTADGIYGQQALAEFADTDVLAVGLEPVTDALLSNIPRLKLVQRLGVGYDNIDLESASRRAVPVCNMPDFNAVTVAEHTLMLILALLRRLFDSTLLMKAGHWPSETIAQMGTFDLQGRVLGILGLGMIGQEVARRARAFDVEMCYYDTRRSPSVEAELRVSFASLAELLHRSDIVTCHLPLTPDTRRLLGSNEFARMKRTAVFINTARGAITDETALAAALKDGLIAGAGLDVFAEEPLDPRHPLRRSPNVLFTAHMAGQTREAMERMVALLLDNIQRVVRNDEPRFRVNR